MEQGTKRLPEEVIEISDDEVVVVGDEPDDDVQITGATELDGITEISRVRLRDGRDGGGDALRRRLNDDDDDIEILDVRPLARELRFTDPSGETHYRDSLVRRILTPVGDFHTTEDAPRRPPSRPAPNGWFSLTNALGARNVRMATRNRPLPTPNTDYLQIQDFILERLSGGFGFAPEQMFQDQQTVENSIMERIERDNENALDARLESEKIFNRKALAEKQALAEQELKGYTNSITSTDNAQCEVCGVTLGEGIPDDFTPNPKYNDKLAHHASEFHVPAPWFCIKQLYDTDRVFSKRVFVARCGHLFCGRCIKNIVNRSPTRKRSTAITIDNPLVLAPRRCPADQCTRTFTKGKRVFNELYL